MGTFPRKIVTKSHNVKIAQIGDPSGSKARFLNSKHQKTEASENRKGHKY